MIQDSSPEIIAKSHTIALVEDDARIGLLVKELIDQAQGFECVAHFSCAETALIALPELAPDIVVTDINLPKASGITCVRNLKPKMPGTQFVILTVYDDADVIFEALSAGAVGFLLKRAVGLELEIALHDVLLGGSPMSSGVARKVVKYFQTPTTVAPEVERLSDRERQVLDLLARGLFYKEIADEMTITQNTVHSYIRRIYEKLQVHSRLEAVAKLSPVSRPAG